MSRAKKPVIYGPYTRCSQKRPYYTTRFYHLGKLYRKESTSKAQLENYIHRITRNIEIIPRDIPQSAKAPCGKTIIPLPGRCETAYKCSDYLTCCDLADKWPGWRIKKKESR